MVHWLFLVNNLLKTIAPVILGMIVAASARAQFDNPVRVINRQKVDISPLFSWWTNTEAIIKTNARIYSRKDKLPLPKRPLAAWSRVSGVCSNGNQFGWILHARISPQPGSNYSAAIFLRNPPENKRRELEAAAVRLEKVSKQLDNANASADYNREVASAHSQRGQLYNDIANLDPAGNRSFRDGANAHYQQSNEASRQARAAELRAENLSREQSALMQTTKGWKVFHFEDFAMRTAETYNGLPVYDVGAR